MKPVIPWSIKGIESETREAAKAAARRSGMTLGQWLNSKIQDEAALAVPASEVSSQDSQKKSPKRSEKKTVKKTKAKVKKKKQVKKTGDIDDRLALLADQLTAISKDRQATAVNRFVGYDDEPAANKALEAMIKRIESGESQSRKSFEKVNTRLDVIDEKLTVSAVSAVSKDEPDDQSPEFQALESALRNIVDHIETSEKRNRDALGNMQDRMSEISKRAEKTQNTSVNQMVPELAALDARVTDLAFQHEQTSSSSQQENRSYLEERLTTIGEQIDAVRHSTDAMTERAEISAGDVARKESREVEQRVAGMIGEARELMLKSAPSGEMLGSIRSEIESLNQRFDDIKAEAASDHDVQTLKLAIEKLTSSVSANSASANLDTQPLVAMEQRLGELTQRLDETPVGDHMLTHFADLENRIVGLDSQLAIAINQQGDAAAFSALESQISLVADRISATEEKLGALTTIETSIAQLYTAIDDNKAEVQAVADGAATREINQQGTPADVELGHSPELVALEQGLAAVKQSSHDAEQHNQETLEAVHETLEQIITKLADMEARDVASQTAAQMPQPAPESESSDGNANWQATVQSHLQESLVNDPVDVSPAFDPAQLGQTPEMMPQSAVAQEEVNLSVGFQDSLPRQSEEIAPVIAEVTMSPDNSPPLDYIAQARLASQTAAPQPKSSLAASAGFFTDKIMPGRKAGSQDGIEGDENGQTAKKSKSLFSLPFLSKKKSGQASQAGETGQTGEISNNNDPLAKSTATQENPGSRKRLILAGLVLLIAAGSFAYGKVGNKNSSNQQASSVPTVSAPVKAMPKSAGPTTAAQPKKTSQSIDQTSDVKNLVKQVSLSLPQKAQQINRASAAAQTGMPINQALEAANRVNDPVSSAPVDQVATASLPPAPTAAHKIRSPLNIQTGARTSPPQIEETSPEPTSEPAGQHEANLPPEKTGTIDLRRAAAKGDASAQFVIASRFVDGKRVKKDYSQAAKWYQKAASTGLPPAQYRLGTLFERGNGVPKDLKAARLWYERAAEKGNVKAMHNLAVIYAGTKNGQTDFAKAKKWFEQASNHGLKDSQYNLAVIHERGLAGGRSQKEALYWYSLAAAHGDRDAGVKAHSLKNYLTGPDIKAVQTRISAWKPLKALKSGNFVAIKDPKWQVVNKTRGQPALGAKPALAGKALVQSAQSMLSKLGFDVGGTDGVMGSRTANAVRLFQLQNGLQVNGMVSNTLLQQLQARS